MLTYNLSSLKQALLEDSKITEEEYKAMYPLVEALENDLSVQVFSYELGEIQACLAEQPIFFIFDLPLLTYLSLSDREEASFL